MRFRNNPQFVADAKFAAGDDAAVDAGAAVGFQSVHQAGLELVHQLAGARLGDDFDHHIAHGVHRGVHYIVLSRQGDTQRVQQKFRVFGMPKTDELLASQAADGSVVHEFVKGDFAGGNITVRFVPDGPARTRLEATLTAPLRGINRLIAPLLRRVVAQLTAQSLEEDRRDLEEHGYMPARRSAAA